MTALKLESLFYTYKELGTVEKDGVKFKKFVRVPRLRSKHRQAVSRGLAAALFTAFLGAAAVRLLGWLVERPARPAEAYQDPN